MMEKTWRWFGKKDKITLPMLRQIGVEGIVTALHDIPNGEIWTIIRTALVCSRKFARMRSDQIWWGRT